ncbi:hypothetical protein FSPOR_11695 [Fusarium sporotrichioides]|uniref:Chromo domain-containing protein n=1 Tax=Fusarium sporotrichioides TaxID=5514 RepID=A0A395RFV7_FUSSP|nr:hypothetical protein FSPOR_11695 [Fusarium sporotrichioides]
MNIDRFRGELTSQVSLVKLLTMSPENYEASSPDRTKNVLLVPLFADPFAADYLPVRITHHRCVKSDYTVRLTIEMGNGRRIILQEREMQATYPEIVYRYWRMFQGGRCSATGFDLYHPFHVISHRKTQGSESIEYKIQWVGYSKKQCTWEKGEDLAVWSAELKDGYDKANGL